MVAYLILRAFWYIKPDCPFFLQFVEYVYTRLFVDVFCRLRYTFYVSMCLPDYDRKDDDMPSVSVTKRGSYWQYRFEIASVDGKRKQRSKSGFNTKREALQAGTEALAEYNKSGQVFSVSNISVSDYLDYWFDTYCKMNLRTNTQISYLGIIENHLKPTFGSYRLAGVTTEMVQNYANSLKIRGFSRSSVFGILNTLSGAYEYAIRPLNYVRINPCSDCKYPRYSQKATEARHIISKEDFDKIISRFTPKSNFYIPLMIGYYAGLRISECFGLTWDDIDFERNTINVNKQVIKRNYGVDIRQVLQKKGKKEEKSAWYFSAPKTQTSTRVVDFGETLRCALLQARDAKRQNEQMYGEYFTKIYQKPETDEKGDKIIRLIEIESGVPCSLKEADMVCVRENGQYISTDSFKYCARVIHHELQMAFNYHSLRHTHATFLIQAGASVKDVQTRLGHTDVSTTLNSYVHSTPESKKDAVSKFESYLSSM